jgi:hypothetical protein
MKKVKLAILAGSIAIPTLFAFTSMYSGSISGAVKPADGASRAWAISGADTSKSVIQNGHFEFMDLKPGTYKLIIEAKPPYKNLAKDNVTVLDGQPTNLGEIKLEQ